VVSMLVVDTTVGAAVAATAVVVGAVVLEPGAAEPGVAAIFDSPQAAAKRAIAASPVRNDSSLARMVCSPLPE
jgi:hypothetical protein